MESNKGFFRGSHGQVSSGVSNWKAMKGLDDRMRFWVEGFPSIVLVISCKIVILCITRGNEPKSLLL